MNSDLETETLSEYVARLGLTATVEPAASNPNADGFGPDARHWLVTLHLDGRDLPVPFSQGSAHVEPPTVADVLECLASDSAGLDSAVNYSSWCAEYGYETDERSLDLFATVTRQANALAVFLGGHEYDTLLWAVERQ